MTSSKRDQLRDVQGKIKLYLSVGRFDAAEKLLLATLAEHGPLSHMHNLLGVTFHKQARFPEAVKEFRSAIKCNPKFIEASLNLAATLCDLSRYEEAQEVFSVLKSTAASRGVPELVLGRIANLHAQNGKMYEEAAMINEAVQEYRRALNLFPNMPDVKLALARIYLRSNQPEKAQRELEDILTANEEFWDARTLLGLALYKAGRKTPAQDQWRKVQRDNPNDLVSRAFLKITDFE